MKVLIVVFSDGIAITTIIWFAYISLSPDRVACYRVNTDCEWMIIWRSCLISAWKENSSEAPFGEAFLDFFSAGFLVMENAL